MPRTVQENSSPSSFGVGVLLAVGLALAPTLSGADVSPRQLQRGEYLATRVGMCGDCHTPLDDKGEPDRAHALQGAPIDFQPAHPVPGWATVAPPIAGLPGWSDAAALKFLETGIAPNGKRAAPPMPWYRFSRSDAEALLAYLRSLGTSAAKPAEK